MPDSVRGSCLCGGVTFEVELPFRRANHCHCSLCRKHSGTFGLTPARVPRDQFQLLSVEQVAAGRARLAAAASLRGVAAPLAEDRQATELERAELACDAVSPAVTARTAGAEPQLVPLDPDRIGELERLGRRRERV